MKKTIALVVLLLLPASAFAQRPNRGQKAQVPQRNVIEIVLEHKADLTLNDEQVTKLQAVAKQLDEKNKPTLEELKKLRDGGARPRDMSEEQREAVRKATETIRENREKALTEARALLTEDQKKSLKKLMEEQRRGRKQG